jgi:nicotinate-nucleotide adenylyltransferase
VRIGVFGGTFDPIHTGHLVAAVNAKYAADLDLCYFVVANVPWQKEGMRELTPARIRYSLVERAIEGLEGFEVSDIELRHGGHSYTVETLRGLREMHPEDDLVLVVGADAAANLPTWERSEDLPSLAELLVVSRPGFSPPERVDPWSCWSVVEIPSLDISSTDLRSRARDGRPLDFLLPRFAIEFIAETGLYQNG